MARIETSVRIAAPPELVFAFFVPQRMAYWYGADLQICLEVQGGAPDFAITQKVRITGHLGKQEVSHTAVVTELQPPRVFEWRFKDRYGVQGLERWELEPVGAPSGLAGTNVLKLTVPPGPVTAGIEYDYLRLELDENAKPPIVGADQNARPAVVAPEGGDGN